MSADHNIHKQPYYNVEEMAQIVRFSSKYENNGKDKRPDDVHGQPLTVDIFRLVDDENHGKKESPRKKASPRKHK